MIGPHTAPPVQNAERILGRECESFLSQLYGAGGPHTVDFLVVVEMTALFKWSADDNGFVRLPGQYDINVDCLAILEVFHMCSQFSLPVTDIKGQSIVFSGDFADTGYGGTGEVGFSHGENSHGTLGDLPGGIAEPEERDGVQTHIAVVGNGQRDAESVISNIVVVPFFQTGETAFDLFAVINRKQTLGVTGFRQISLWVQKGNCGRDLMLHRIISLLNRLNPLYHGKRRRGTFFRQECEELTGLDDQMLNCV